MNTLSLAQIMEKNKLYSNGAYPVLIEIRFNEEQVIRICNDSHDITWRGFTWVAFPFDLGEIKYSGGGETQEVSLGVSNVLRVMQSYVENAKGGVDTEVIIRVVSTESLDDVNPLAEEILGVSSTNIDEDNIAFTLGPGIPLFLRFPERRFLKNFCDFEYGGIECAASSLTMAQYPTCNRTLTACIERQNGRRFGGEPTMGQGGFYA